MLNLYFASKNAENYGPLTTDESCHPCLIGPKKIFWHNDIQFQRTTGYPLVTVHHPDPDQGAVRQIQPAFR